MGVFDDATSFVEDTFSNPLTWVNPTWGVMDQATGGNVGQAIQGVGDRGGGGTQTTTQEPWRIQQPYLEDVFRQAQGLYNLPGPEYYPFATTGPLGLDTQQGLDLQRQWALGSGQRLARQGERATRFGLSDVLRPDANPYLRAQVQAAIRPITENFQQNVLPSIGSRAQQAGAYGGARHGLAEGTATDAYLRNVGERSADLYSRGYGQGLDTFSRTLAMLPQTMQAGQMPGQALRGVGGVYDAYNQQLIEDDMARWQYYAQLPYQKLAQYQGAISGNYGSVVNQPAPRSNMLMNMLGGAASGYALTGNPYGAGAGAFLGWYGSRQ